MLPDTLANNKVSVVILAGGAGRRMSGRDKGLIPLHGKALVVHVLEKLSAQTERLFINCNRSQEEYARFGYPLLADNLPGGLGPLAGLLSALENTDTEYVLTVPCDTPFLPGDLVSRMLETLLQCQADACTVDDGERLHPVILLVRRSVLPGLKAYLKSGKRKVHDWFYSVPHCCTDFSGQPEAFININTQEQLEAASQ